MRTFTLVLVWSFWICFEKSTIQMHFYSFRISFRYKKLVSGTTNFWSHYPVNCWFSEQLKTAVKNWKRLLKNKWISKSHFKFKVNHLRAMANHHMTSYMFLIAPENKLEPWQYNCLQCSSFYNAEKVFSEKWFQVNSVTMTCTTFITT